MTEDEIIEHMESIQLNSALFDWLEMFDSHQCECTFELLMASTCELTIDKANLDDLMRLV